jgi:hypothetical protein
MAIVATENGSLVPCEGGRYKLEDGTSAITALSWDEVDEIVERFSSLNPYDPERVPGILKVEDENRDEDGNQKQLYAYAISAKRYALFNRFPTGEVLIRKHSEHGLGHLLNPANPHDEDRDWIEHTWHQIVGEELGLSHQELEWLDRPAISRLGISKPRTAKLFDAINDGRSYAHSIKPFGFMLAAHVALLGHPVGTDHAKFQLVAPFEPDSAKWEDMSWINRHDGKSYRISVNPEHRSKPTIAQVKTYADTLREYRHHPEMKSLDPNGQPSDLQSVGLLKRRSVYELNRVTIGKEANLIEEQQTATIHDTDEVLNEFKPPGQDTFALHVVPILKTLKASDLASQAGVSAVHIKAIRNLRARPSDELKAELTKAAADEVRRIRPEARNLGDEIACAVNSYWPKAANQKEEPPAR